MLTLINIDSVLLLTIQIKDHIDYKNTAALKIASKLGVPKT